MSLPQRNATLTKVARGGTSEDYDAPEGADPTAWEGSSDCYVGERRATLTEGRVLNRERVVYALVPGTLDVRVGDTITYRRDDAGEPESRDVRAVKAPALTGLAPWPKRLDLDPR